MNTLGEDILALQKRLLEETGLEFDLCLYAHESGRYINSEQAIRVGEILVAAIGAPAQVEERNKSAWLRVKTPSIEAAVFCKELLGKADA